MADGYSFDRFEIYPAQRRVFAGGEHLALGGRAFDLLLCLIDHRERVVGKDELLEQVWPGVVVEEGNLTVQVSTLRKLLGTRAVLTVPGRGYRFGLPVAELAGGQRAVPAPTTPIVRTVLPVLPDKPSLAVLPFDNLSGDPAQEYFADGVVDEIITALSRVRAFYVMARSSSFIYKGRAVDIKQVGRELGVRYVLEGSIRRADERLRINAQLIEAENGRHVWADRFEGAVNDVFELQDRITESVVVAIEPNLRLAEAERARAKPSASLQAYDLCLRAVSDVLDSGGEVASREAIVHLRHAIALDPQYSYAKALCAWCLAMCRMQGWITSSEAQEGVRLAEEALADHQDDYRTLTFVAHTLSLLAHRHEEALVMIDRAAALNPNSVLTLGISGWIRFNFGDVDTSKELFLRAIRLNPLDPAIGYSFSGLGYAYLMTGGRDDEALAWGQKALIDKPKFVASHLLVTHSLVQLGRIEEARRAAARVIELIPRVTIAGLRRAAPYRDTAFVERQLAALRTAGIPESS
jgi:adenylate cyclase